MGKVAAYQYRVKENKAGAAWVDWRVCSENEYQWYCARIANPGKFYVYEVRTLCLSSELDELKHAALEVLTARDNDDAPYGHPSHCHGERGKWDRDGSKCEHCAAYDKLASLVGATVMTRKKPVTERAAYRRLDTKASALSHAEDALNAYAAECGDEFEAKIYRELAEEMRRRSVHFWTQADNYKADNES